MWGRLTIHYPVGKDSTLTGQTKQELSTSLYRLLGDGTLSKVTQDFVPVIVKPDEVNFNHGTYKLVLSPNAGVKIEHVRGLVEELLIFHPGATLQP